MFSLKFHQRIGVALSRNAGTAAIRLFGNKAQHRCRGWRQPMSPSIQLKSLPYTVQCKRYYAQLKMSTCWKCNKSTTMESPMLCTECGHLQDVANEINYFNLLNCPQNYDIDPQALTRHFRKLQTIVHPDKYSNKSEREQRNSADWSSLINKAYKTLAAPMERGQYLLQLNGLSFPQDNSALNKEFLMEMMERNEEIEDADNEKQLRQLDERIVDELRKQVKELTVQFKQNELDAATTTLVQMKYLLSMQQSIKTKLQSLLN